jgi:hypothetical protein
LDGYPSAEPVEVYIGAASLTTGVTGIPVEAQMTFQEIYPLGAGVPASGITSISGASGSYITTAVNGTSIDLNTTKASSAQAGLVAANVPIAQNSLVQQGASSAVGCVLQSSDSTVIITPSEGIINLSSPLNISSAGSPLLPVKENNLLFSSIAPTIEWQADYIVSGNSTGAKKNVFDSAGTFTQNYTATSSQISLGEWTRFTATTTSPPSANNVASPQWVCCMQPLPVTALKARAIEILVSSYLVGAGSTQALAYGKGGLMSYTIAVNMTTTAGVPNFVAATPFPFSANSGGSEGVPTVADQPVNLLFEIVPATSSPSAQFTTGDVVVMSAQWILSTTTGVTVSFDISLKALF